MNVPVSRAAEGFARRAFTIYDIRRMHLAGVLGEDEKFELIEGEIVPVSPKGNQYEVLKAALIEFLVRHKGEDLRLAVETSVYLSATSFVEPDICLYPKQLLPEDVKGHQLLLIVEIAGSSLGYDRGPKSRIYASHGVRELWVIDAASRVTWVHKQPQFDGSWGSIDEMPPQVTLVPEFVPGVSVVLTSLD
jgi:Uma2 family endonuclease